MTRDAIFEIYQVSYDTLTNANPLWAVVSAVNPDSARLLLQTTLEKKGKKYSVFRVLEIKDTGANCNLEGVLSHID